MSSSVDKSSDAPKTLLTSQTFLYAAGAWAVLAVLYFLLFSISAPGEERSHWYLIGTYVFEEVAYLGAALLCFRNWRSPQIVSGRNVWLGFGLGMLFYFIGTLLFGFWELGLGQNPTLSPGDLFYVGTYICLIVSMILAVVSRRLNLEVWQWAIVAAIAAAGIALAVWLSIAPVQAEKEPPVAPKQATTQVNNSATANKAIAQKAPVVKKPTAVPDKAIANTQAKPAPVKEQEPPAWVISVEEVLEPLAAPVSIFYIVSDVFLLIIATTLLLAFWGGRFSLSWRMIAGAAFSLYIADMWLKYAENYIGDDYQSGFVLEVFWVFSGVLFAIGAVLEYDTSSRTTRRGGRKRA